jgi:hypothetical protein
MWIASSSPSIPVHLAAATRCAGARPQSERPAQRRPVGSNGARAAQARRRRSPVAALPATRGWPSCPPFSRTRWGPSITSSARPMRGSNPAGGAVQRSAQASTSFVQRQHCAFAESDGRASLVAASSVSESLEGESGRPATLGSHLPFGFLVNLQCCGGIDLRNASRRYNTRHR